MTAAETPSHPLQATARWTAAVRAGERLRPDRLVDDPWAERLAGPDGMAWLAGRTPESVVPIVVRTRFFDDWLREVAIAGELRQVVLLAAGLDTRAWRLPWRAGTTVFEVDHGAVLAAKAGVMDAVPIPEGCTRRVVAADLTAGWPATLLDAGFAAATPTAWLVEGVLFYLPDAAIGRVIDGLTSLAAPGSRLGFDAVNHAALTSPYTRAWLEMQAAAGAPWLGAIDDPGADLAARGWTAVVTQPGEPAANHGRWTLPVPPRSIPDLPRSWYVTATRP